MSIINLSNALFIQKGSTLFYLKKDRVIKCSIFNELHWLEPIKLALQM